MADLKTYIATLSPRTIIRGVGDPAFFKSLKTISGSQLRWKKIEPTEPNFSFSSLADRLLTDSDTRPVVVIGAIRKGRRKSAEAFKGYDVRDKPDLILTADFAHAAVMSPGGHLFKIIDGKFISVEATL
jgi:hypothetical protein